MKVKPFCFATTIMIFGAFSGMAGATSDNVFVAGVEPSMRPATAPEITEIQRDPQWRKDALRGVEAPYPDSLQFLDSQGNWFNPFSHPGMPGPYDLRGWH